MNLALISDVHGNLEALSAVEKSLQTQDVDRILFLGDCVGYGANPNECVGLLKNLADHMLAGNHDWAAVGKSSAANFNPVAKTAIEWTRDQLTGDNYQLLSSLPLKASSENFMCVHSTPYLPEDWHYILNVFDARICFDTFTNTVCFVAHSHMPVIFMQNADGKIVALHEDELTFQKKTRYIINIGSVGQPRDGNPRAGYGLFNTETRTYRLVRVHYDVQRAQQKIIDAGLPEILALRLGVGK